MMDNILLFFLTTLFLSLIFYALILIPQKRIKKILAEVKKTEQRLKGLHENEKILKKREEVFGDKHTVQYVSPEHYHLICSKSNQIFNEMKN